MTTIRIRQYQFDLLDLYAEGSVLTHGEAQALNSLRAENIRNNVTKPVLDAIAGLPAGAVLSAKDQASLQSTISAYAASYKFMSRHVPGLRPAAIAVEAEAIASAQLAAEGQGAVSPEALLAFAALPEVQAEARRRVAARLQVTGKLEDLL